MTRDYKKEYKAYHGKKSQIKKRALRNKARKKKGLAVGDGKVVHHKKGLSRGGSNASSNLRVMKKRAHQKKGPK